MERPLTIPLGPFDLKRPIGQGGMAEVWSGVHRASGLEVAVKLIVGEQARDPDYLTLFRNEVRAMASLEHPNIVLVFDHGEVDEVASSASEGRLTEGSPFLVMELASSGALDTFTDPRAAPLGWRDLRSLLLVLLDALSHAHARGIIHRDLKPGNVLICGASDTRPGLKLADFGLAHLHEHATGSDMGVIGTPGYMAPEQLWDRWRDFGPWTDLYAFGCMAFQLSTGELPFQGDDLASMLAAHATHQVVPFRPRRSVPTGFRNWLETLFALRERERFECAADAARALLSLGEAEASADAVVAGASLDPLDDLLTVALGERSLDEALEKAERMRSDSPPPVRKAGPDWVAPPSTWKESRSVAPSGTHLLGAGLGLYGLREIPLVDRMEQRDALWDEVRRVADERQVRAILLHGPSGCGKSRLAEWLVRRTLELGATHVLHASHGESSVYGEGLRDMLARVLRTQGLSGESVDKRIDRFLRERGVENPDEVAALAQLVDPDEARVRVRFGSPRERYLVVERLARLLADDRPLLIWLDDVQWGPDSLGCVQAMLEAEAPIVVLLTAREEALAERSTELGLVREILGSPHARRIHVGPLEDADRAALIGGLLGLEGPLALQVEERTAGNALFAVQLVGDWVRRGLLEPAERGFRLRPGATIELPDDVHVVWNARIERLLEGRPEGDGWALELAAVLGQEVYVDEWYAVCAEAGFAASAGLLDSLLADRLARPSEAEVASPGNRRSWSFVHGMLRESLIRRAADTERLAGHHLAAAQTLASRGQPERRATHLLEAGAAEDALSPLLKAARARRSEGAYDVAAGLLARRAAALAASDPDPADPRWGEQLVEEAALLRQRGDLDAAMAVAVRADEASRRQAAASWGGVRAIALRERGVIARLRGEAVESRRLLEEACAAASSAGRRRLHAEALRERAEALVREGALQEAQAGFGLAQAEYDGAGEEGWEAGVAMCQRGLAGVARQAGRWNAAAQHLGHAREAFQRTGSRWGVAVCLNDLAEVHRHNGDLASAERLYREALERHEAIGSTNAIFPQINLAQVLTARGDDATARPILEAALATVRAQGRRSLEGAVHALLLPCLAASSPPDWEAWDRHAASAEADLAATGQVDVDIAQAFERAGQLASEAGEHARATAAWELALAQWVALKRDDEAEVVRRRLV